MTSRVARDAQEYQRRFALATDALDRPMTVAAMSRMPTATEEYQTHGSTILAGRERLRSARRVGLLATSMNPLTQAHMALADAACVAARLDALAWVAAQQSVDKERVSRASLPDRLLAAWVFAHSSGDGLLLVNGGLYVEQARMARALLAPEIEISLIVGFDKVPQIFDPRYYVDRDAALYALFKEAEMVVAPRAGASEADLAALLSRPENRPFAPRVRFCPLPEEYTTDSSSDARTLAAGGRESRALREVASPEGLALTLASEPYMPERGATDNDPGDSYTVRQAYLAACENALPVQAGALPRVGEMVDWSGEDSPRGAALRQWLRSSPRTLAGLDSALSAR